MLSAARRSISSFSASSLLATSRSSFPSTLPPLSAPFSSSAPSHEAPRLRLSKAKRADRTEKLAKKRVVRGIQREREERRRELRRLEEHRRGEEVREKRVVAEEIADALPAVSEAQLDSMYRGLLSASPSELSNPLLAAPPSAPALPDPAKDSQERQERLTLLEKRLEELEGELREEVGVEEGREGLAERLRKGREKSEEALAEEGEEEAERPAQVPAVAVSPARALLDRVGELLPEEQEKKGEEEASEGAVALPRGLLSRSEWSDLVVACAEAGDREGVHEGLKLMDRTTPISEGKVLEDTLAVYAEKKRPQDALALASFARQNSLPLSVTAHHHLLASILPSHPELALRHLKSMEAAGHTPLLPTYTAVIKRLLQPGSPHLVREGWDLYANTRAVAFPVPDMNLYSTMILACGSGAHPAPERAVDLFTEMTNDNRLPATEAAYNGVIRACAREGSQEYYLEALRYMRRMLDENVMPSRHTFHAVLEGAKKHGDLARARWMLVKMIGLGGETAPTEKTLALLFQTYATYEPESRVRNEVKPPNAEGVKRAKTDEEKEALLQPERAAGDISLDASEDPTVSPLVQQDSSGAGPSTQAVIEMLGEASLFYPGPMPRTSAEVVAEARNLMLQVVDASILARPSSSSPDEPTTPPPARPASSMFPDVEPTTFLLNSFFSVLSHHAPLPASRDFFQTAYARLGVPKNRYTFVIAMRRCETGRIKVKPEQNVALAKGIFEEWLSWRDEPFPAHEHEAVDEQGNRVVDPRKAEQWRMERMDGRTASKLWRGLIRVLARTYQTDEALTVLRRFVELYPPALLAKGVTLPTAPPASANPAAPPSRPSPLPAVPIRMSSPLYPETSPSLDPLRPPFLSFSHLSILHLRLVEKEDKEGLAYVTYVTSAYASALRTAKRKEAKREKK
ncbi:hypothetical protein JCM8547_002576 [Rhodosporidiobolus lusitaniae]